MPCALSVDRMDVGMSEAHRCVESGMGSKAGTAYVWGGRMEQASVRSRLAEHRATESGTTMISDGDAVIPMIDRERRSGRYGRTNL